MAEDKKEAEATPPNWLKPYTNLEMMLEAMMQYSVGRWHYANMLNHPNFLRDGVPISVEEANFAIECARQADDIVLQIKNMIAEKTDDGPRIIRVQ